MNKKVVAIVLLVVALATIALVLGSELIPFQYESPPVEYKVVEGEVRLGFNMETWSGTTLTAMPGQSWYASFTTLEDGYRGNVSITWTLQKIVLGEWVDQDVSIMSYAHISGRADDIVYCSKHGWGPTDGISCKQFDWGSHIVAEEDDMFRVRVAMLPYDGEELPYEVEGWP